MSTEQKELLAAWLVLGPIEEYPMEYAAALAELADCVAAA